MKKPGSGKKVDFIRVLEIKRLRNQNLSLRKIAEKTKLSVSTVVKYVKMLESIKMDVENVA